MCAGTEIILDKHKLHASQAKMSSALEDLLPFLTMVHKHTVCYSAVGSLSVKTKRE